MQPLFGERNQVLIIDWANLVARAFSIRGDTIGNFTTLFLEMIFKLKRTYPNYQLVFALEGKGTNRRREIWPEYKKGARKPQDRPPSYDKLAIKILNCLNCKIILAPDGEADDAIAAYLKQELGEAGMAIIVTEDRDLYQLVAGSNIKIHTRGGRLLDEVGVFQKLGGIQPNEVVLYKSLMGDKSDNIPKVRGLGKKAAIQAIQGCSSLKQLYKHTKKCGLQERHKKAILASKDLILRNKRLVHLRGDHRLEITEKTPKPNKLSKLLHMHNVWKWSKDELKSLTR